MCYIKKITLTFSVNYVNCISFKDKKNISDEIKTRSNIGIRKQEIYKMQKIVRFIKKKHK